MIVTSTEVQNNFGKYLTLATQEEIIITRNGTAIARLLSMKDEMTRECQAVYATTLQETAEPYHFEGKRASYQEFLELTQDVENRYEYIDGEIYLLASPVTAHQVAITELIGTFYNWFQGSKCRPFVAPYDIRLKRPLQEKGDPNVVQPDLMVICDLEEHLNERDYYVGVPELIVEVLSRSTQGKDMIKKLDLYMACGVKEYWIVNPRNQEVTVYEFNNGEIRRNATYKNDEAAQSYIFAGLSAELKQIFKSS